MSKQPSKDKELTIKETLKQFLRLNKNVPQPSSSSAAGFIKYKPEEFCLNAEVLKEIGQESPASQRLKGLKRLPEEFAGKRLENNAVENLWLKMRDLLNPQQPKGNRQAAFAFLKALVSSQYDWLEPLMDAQLFHLIRTHDVTDDLPERIELLKVLSRNGREIEHFEEEIGPFLLHCMSVALSTSCILDFLQILVNIIKFNSTYLDKEIIMKIIWLTCHYACHTTTNDGVVLCLQVLEAVICYSCLPSDSLECMITTLCRTVNVEKFSQHSWKLIRNLLGTHLGHSSLYTMCNILQQRENHDDFVLLRGAVFFIGMCLWGSQKVSSLKFTHSVVLPFFLNALESDHMIVSMEVSLSVQRLVRKYGHELLPNTWGLVMDLLEALLDQSQSKNTTQAAMLSSNIHEIITTVEELHIQKQYNGCDKRLFSIIEASAVKRPESSVLRLVCYKAQLISPLKSNWLNNLKNVVDKYYKNETRTAIRIKVLEVLYIVLDDNRHVYEDDIIEKIILPALSNVDCDADTTVRNAAVQLLCKLALECGSKPCLDILDILAKVILQPFDQPSVAGSQGDDHETVHVISENEFCEVKTAILGLIEIFQKKLYVLPSSIATTVLRLLIKHFQSQYQSLVIFKEGSSLRTMVIECLLSLRANEIHQLGILEHNSSTVKYSKYLFCSYLEKNVFGATSPPPVSSPTHFSYPPCSPTYVSLEPFFHVLSVCLKQEKDWVVLRHVLLELPKMLQNKTILLSSPGSVGSLCGSVCALLGDRNLKLPESLRNNPVTLSRAEFHSHVYPIQVALVSYHKYLDTNMQRFLVTCLRHGLISKCARACIMALTLCTLEMNDTMYKLLPEVLLGLSKISATVNIAIPILEFLSTLIQLPKLYASFVQDQYMSIFAIALPYTNPFKFNHYIVSLAHHVIAMWFIKCRLPFRKDFVRFIVKGLRNNVLVPFDEGVTLTDFRPTHEDQARAEQNAYAKKTEFHEALGTFHKELTETCIDLLTRYTFAFCTTLPRRTQLTEFLLTSGQSSTWILGNAVVTITTSGCSTRATKFGMCEKCYSFCRGSSHVFPNEDLKRSASLRSGSTGRDYQTRRRHHSAAIQRSISADTQVNTPQIKDDIQLRSGVKESDEESTSDEFVKDGLSGSGSQSLGSKSGPQLCCCWCQGWTEVLIRRPTGNTSWIMRIQNQLQSMQGNLDFSVSDIASLLLSTHLLKEIKSEGPILTRFGHERIDSESQEEEENKNITHTLPPLRIATEKKPLASGTVPTDSFAEQQVIHDECKKADESAIGEIFECKESDKDKSLKVSPCPEKLSGSSESSSLRKANSSPDILMELDSQDGKACESDERGSDVSSDYDSVKVDVVPPDRSNSGVIRRGSTSVIKAESAVSVAEVKSSLYKSAPKDQSFFKEGDYVIAPESRIVLPFDEPRKRHSSSIDHRPPRLPEIVERRALSPVHKTSSAPLSPLPLAQIGHSDVIPIRRDRGHTISVMSPVRHKWLPGATTTQPRVQEGQHSGINPSFVFLQLYYSFRFGVSTEKPVLLPKSEAVERALKVLDCIHPHETHKIGVMYVGPGQAQSEAAILANQFGSVRYTNFLHGLGRLIRLEDINPRELYTGGLDLSGPDGKFTYVWQDDVMQVMFHVATLMPTKKSDPSGNQKKLHIGNDFVSIVYNDSGEDYNIYTMKGQFIYVCVIIQPLDKESNLVIVKTKPELSELLGNHETKIVSDCNLATLVRQLALHANLASVILQSQQRSPNDPYASNWLERLRQIRRLRDKHPQDNVQTDEDCPGPDSGWSHHTYDFTGFV